MKTFLIKKNKTLKWNCLIVWTSRIWSILSLSILCNAYIKRLPHMDTLSMPQVLSEGRKYRIRPVWPVLSHKWLKWTTAVFQEGNFVSGSSERMWIWVHVLCYLPHCLISPCISAPICQPFSKHCYLKLHLYLCCLLCYYSDSVNG